MLNAKRLLGTFDNFLVTFCIFLFIFETLIFLKAQVQDTAESLLSFLTTISDNQFEESFFSNFYSISIRYFHFVDDDL